MAKISEISFSFAEELTCIIRKFIKKLQIKRYCGCLEFSISYCVNSTLRCEKEQK